MTEREIDAAIVDKMWQPKYLPYRRVIRNLDEG